MKTDTMKSNSLRIVMLCVWLAFISLTAGAQTTVINNTYQQLTRFIDTVLMPLKNSSTSLAFSIKAEINQAGNIIKLDCSTNVAGDLKPRLFRLRDLDIKWNKLTGKSGKYFIIIPVYFIVEHSSGKVQLTSRTEFTNGFYFDDGDLFDNKFLSNYFFLKPIYVQRYFGENAGKM